MFRFACACPFLRKSTIIFNFLPSSIYLSAITEPFLFQMILKKNSIFAREKFKINLNGIFPMIIPVVGISDEIENIVFVEIELIRSIYDSNISARTHEHFNNLFHLSKFFLSDDISEQITFGRMNFCFIECFKPAFDKRFHRQVFFTAEEHWFIQSFGKSFGI